MATTIAIWLLLIIIFCAANFPWLNERFLLFMQPAQKKTWMRLLEWLLMYFIVGMLALGIEKKSTGQIYPQDWEFFAVGFFLFAVFAFPGFIYHHHIKKSFRK